MIKLINLMIPEQVKIVEHKSQWGSEWILETKDPQGKVKCELIWSDSMSRAILDRKIVTQVP